MVKKLIAMLKEQPLLLALLAVGIIAMIILILVGFRGKQSVTIGDQASPSSDAFVVYQNKPFRPLRNVNADELMRRDMAAYARKTMAVYAPDKNPAVVFNVETVTEKNGSVVFSGEYEKHSAAIRVTVEPLANDRIRTTIKQDGVASIDSELPSASKLHSFIATLPVTTDQFAVEYSPADGGILIVIADRDPALSDNANTYIREQTGVTELDDIPTNYSYPIDNEGHFPPLEDIGD